MKKNAKIAIAIIQTVCYNSCIQSEGDMFHSAGKTFFPKIKGGSSL